MLLGLAILQVSLEQPQEWQKLYDVADLISESWKKVHDLNEAGIKIGQICVTYRQYKEEIRLSFHLFFNQLFYLSIISWFIKYCPWFSSNIWSKGTIMKATDESGKMTTPSPVVSVTENGKCIVNISLESKRTNQTIFLWIILTSHFMALSQKSMNVALFQRFVEYYRPTWNKIVRHIVWHKSWAPGFLFNWHIHPKGARRVSDSSTRNSERWFLCFVPLPGSSDPAGKWHSSPYRDYRDVQRPMLAMNVTNSLLIVTCQSRQSSVFLNWWSVSSLLLLYNIYPDDSSKRRSEAKLKQS